MNLLSFFNDNFNTNLCQFQWERQQYIYFKMVEYINNKEEKVEIYFKCGFGHSLLNSPDYFAFKSENNVFRIYFNDLKKITSNIKIIYSSDNNENEVKNKEIILKDDIVNKIKFDINDFYQKNKQNFIDMLLEKEERIGNGRFCIILEALIESFNFDVSDEIIKQITSKIEIDEYIGGCFNEELTKKIIKKDIINIIKSGNSMSNFYKKCLAENYSQKYIIDLFSEIIQEIR